MNIVRSLFLCFLAFWLTTSPLFAGPLDKAKAAFSSGDYKKAGKLAAKVAKKGKDKTQKAEAMVLAGAANMKLGKSGKSRFRKALKLDPNVTLPSEAAGDAKIAKAFASAQKKAGTTVSSGGGGSSTDRITKTASGGADKSPSNFKNYLPFGINSFMQGKTLTAVALGGMQVGGLFLFMNRTEAAAAADKDAKAVIADAEENEATEQEQFQQFLSDNDAFVKKANSEATMALMLAMGGYALSIVDSLFDPLGTATASLDTPKNQSYAKLGNQWEDRRVDDRWNFDLQFIPTTDPVLMLTAKQTF